MDENFNGTTGLAKSLRVDLSQGLLSGQVEILREAYGPNSFPEMPMKGFCILFFESFNDTILLVLIAAAIVSLVIGIIEHPDVVSHCFSCVLLRLRLLLSLFSSVVVAMQGYS